MKSNFLPISYTWGINKQKKCFYAQYLKISVPSQLLYFPGFLLVDFSFSVRRYSSYEFHNIELRSFESHSELALQSNMRITQNEVCGSTMCELLFE